MRYKYVWVVTTLTSAVTHVSDLVVSARWRVKERQIETGQTCIHITGGLGQAHPVVKAVRVHALNVCDFSTWTESGQFSSCHFLNVSVTCVRCIVIDPGGPARLTDDVRDWGGCLWCSQDASSGGRGCGRGLLCRFFRYDRS